MTQRVEWKDVSASAQLAFGIWTGYPERGWAEKAWGVLGDAGLTSYLSEIERHQALLLTQHSHHQDQPLRGRAWLCAGDV